MPNGARGRKTPTCQFSIEPPRKHNVHVARRMADDSSGTTSVSFGITHQSAVVKATTATTASDTVHTHTTTNQPTHQPRTRAISIAAGHTIRSSTTTTSATTHTRHASSKSSG